MLLVAEPFHISEEVVYSVHIIQYTPYTSGANTVIGVYNAILSDLK